MTQTNRAHRRAARKFNQRLAKGGSAFKIDDPQAAKAERIRRDLAPEIEAVDYNEPRLQAMYRDLKRELIQHARRGRAQDGLIYAPLRAATGYAAWHVETEHPDLFGAGDADLFAEWLCAKLGETIRDADLDEFREYVGGRAQRLHGLAAAHTATQADDDGDHR